ncbi:MAG: flagellar assembly protein FliW [Sulfurimonas sp.]|nr:flagellar assembly protein FliW [Sulfurimonas sp.]
MTFNLQVPILGFDDIKKVELQKIDDIFMKMQAVENQHISFTLVNPFALTEYDFEVPEKIQKLLEITDNSNLLVMNIVLIQTPIEDSVINFIGPLVFNTDSKKAAQIILQESSKYSVAEKISNFLKK